MCSSASCHPAASRSAVMSPVTLASGRLAAVIPTAGTSPVSRSRSTCRLYPSNSTERDLRPCRISASSTLIRRSRATPRRSAGAGPARSTSWPRTCRAVVTAAAAASWPARPAMNASTWSSRPSTSARAASRAAGSSQSASSAAFRLEAASCGTPACAAATAVPAACPRPCSTAITPRALRRACPIKLKVSSTRPAPHSGEESSAARSARAPNPFRARRQDNRPLDQPPVQVMPDQPLAEPRQGALRKRRILRAQAIQDQLPAPVHHPRLDHLIVTDPRIRLQDRCQRQLRRRNRRLAPRAAHIGLRQLRLEYLVKQLIAVLAQEHEQLRPPHRLDHRLLRRRRLNRRLPHHRTHELPP